MIYVWLLYEREVYCLSLNLNDKYWFIGKFEINQLKCKIIFFYYNLLFDNYVIEMLMQVLF